MGELNGSSADLGTRCVAQDIGAEPEPASFAMMLAGLGLIGFLARRRKP